ncbi:aminoacyl-tRNA hydrolase [Candidatus Kinetoplastidibacterium crithidiae]|uniref:Peptidyl-tRNA hydrolase n=1 Tax=Candidatus Kinetoplastidibacterium crithidiae TCC036E TaxID=1208918 RepID=M1LNY4_9PROT|nr:aminoacyl-tRNA hydrolase [Candidatus Kinetoplastibacterium crithidii]AFZ83121.1 peptidyl-tRNA hydrolase [Candidatus Kinetoplastibacterium crithidii (ex Angomonas deanei ATCC 30255)]AGF47397.1 PTH1 family peptidyl-tRNA hydrolase [Candidatus Kinetoplastibacterium crithidii TCC036E]
MKAALRLIVGLGNPGSEYLTTRHNAGFWLLDIFSEALKTNFVYDKYFDGLISKVYRNSNNIIFFKPSTYMNNSGDALYRLVNFYKINPESILVLHDELDLPPGDIRVKFNGGSAGHNGLRSIQKVIGSDFWRIRIGIGHPRSLSSKQLVSDFVLDSPNSSEQRQINVAMDCCLNCIFDILDGNFETVRNKLKNT